MNSGNLAEDFSGSFRTRESAGRRVVVLMSEGVADWHSGASVSLKADGRVFLSDDMRSLGRLSTS